MPSGLSSEEIPQVFFLLSFHFLVNGHLGSFQGWLTVIRAALSFGGHTQSFPQGTYLGVASLVPTVSVGSLKPSTSFHRGCAVPAASSDGVCWFWARQLAGPPGNQILGA